MCSNPRPNRNIDNGNAVTHDEAGAVLGELLIKRAVETVGFIHVAVDGILELLRGIPYCMDQQIYYHSPISYVSET